MHGHMNVKFKTCVTARRSYCVLLFGANVEVLLRRVYCGPRDTKIHFRNFCIIALFLLTHESRILLNKARIMQNHRTYLLLFTGLGSYLQRKEYIFLLVHERNLDGHVRFSTGINLAEFFR